MSGLRDQIEFYLLRCEVEGKSPNTVRAYSHTLRRFAQAVGDLEPAAIGPERLYDYLARFGHCTLETRHRYFRELRCFFNWLEARGRLADNPFRGMRNVRLPSRIVQPFTPAEITALLAATAATPVGRRDRALVLTLLDTGARCSETVRLELADLNLDARRLRILHGKGNRQRVLPFAERCRDALLHYLELRGRGAGPLFVAANGGGALQGERPLASNGLKQMLRRLGRRAGVERVHAHRFRHTFATWAIQHEARELDVQYLLGHASPDMVRRYSSAYRSEQAAMRHHAFSPGDQMLADAAG
jgi:integrase/recombinase XerC